MRPGTTPTAATPIRRAVPRDAGRLTRVVRTSRAYADRYASAVAGYRVGPDYLAAHRVFVATEGDGGPVLGFYALVLGPPGPAELDLMFVADAAQGRGIGRLLAAHLAAEARAAGATGVRIVAHPPAEGFYLTVGAHRVGTVLASPSVPWDRPELLLPVDGPGPE
ncbi:GNAT family N-acetyltransferase [uncultured Streptomyces sp.]|uniref:GNAT family N-acetyltransferase n=1 Tax=uncultured Streptomyces sp. TaxID=174707 RepID=UPI00262692CA|nr:GNAT family N-acetyltransferase [uncultured Streptomyces sp.]